MPSMHKCTDNCFITAGKLQSMSSPSKDGDKLACANRKIFAGRGPNSPSKFPSSPPGVAMTRSDVFNDGNFRESPALFARQSLDELSRRKSKRITRTHRWAPMVTSNLSCWMQLCMSMLFGFLISHTS